MYAVIQTGGKQYRVEPGMKLKVEKLPVLPGAEVLFDQVVLLVPGEGEVVADPEKLAGARVRGRVLEEGRNRKILVFKKKAKNDYKKSFGHRQEFSLVEISEILPGKAA